MTKFESKNQKGLFFWVEPNEDNPIQSFGIVSQVDGYPATEAWDDWFMYEEDAIKVAEKLANGEL